MRWTASWTLFGTGLIGATLSWTLENGMTLLSPHRDDIDGSRQLEFSETWQALGPFRIGTREAAWGADPLEVIGGFGSLSYNATSEYDSPFGINGTVKWSCIRAKVLTNVRSSAVSLHIDFANIKWDSLRSIYGWSALQYQAWARGSINVLDSVPIKVLLFTDFILELEVNGIRMFGGDFYGFRRAPLILDLMPGLNLINLRLIREVRSMGGLSSSTTVGLVARVAKGTLDVAEDSVLTPDIIDDTLPSSFASVTIRNEGDEWAEVYVCNALKGLSRASLLSPARVSIGPGQSRPIALRIEAENSTASNIELEIGFQVGFKNDSIFISTRFNRRSAGDPHKITFLHPSGVVSYAILRSPALSQNATYYVSDLPVLLNLHGAGLDADSHQVRHMLDTVADLQAWTLFPTGMSPWSGDDWHCWGFADVQAAILAIPDWISSTGWAGPGVLVDNLLASGHSNGGQGSWYISSHQADKVIAAVIASGYTSIQNYVPYTMWKESPPSLTSVVQNALSSFRHELLVENIAQTPVLIQHGDLDDNVPPYHSRLMKSLLREVGGQPQYSELRQKGHWFEGSMETPPLAAFYRKHLQPRSIRKLPPTSFSIIAPSSDDMGSRYGIVIDQLRSSDELGRIDVSVTLSSKLWKLATVNIHRMHFDFSNCRIQPPEVIFLDKTRVALSSRTSASRKASFVSSSMGTWEEASIRRWKGLGQRSGPQRGAMDAILRSRGPFQILMCSEQVFGVALQISRNLFQYYGADTAIISRVGRRKGGIGNTITVGLKGEIPASKLPSFPVRVSETGIRIRTSQSSRFQSFSAAAGVGAIFLRPLENEQLDLVVWGADQEGLQTAARLAPTVTGIGQPDFVITGPGMKWKGLAGALALGFFDYDWNISAASYVS